MGVLNLLIPLFTYDSIIRFGACAQKIYGLSRISVSTQKQEVGTCKQVLCCLFWICNISPSIWLCSVDLGSVAIFLDHAWTKNRVPMLKKDYMHAHTRKYHSTCIGELSTNTKRRILVCDESRTQTRQKSKNKWLEPATCISIEAILFPTTRSISFSLEKSTMTGQLQNCRTHQTMYNYMSYNQDYIEQPKYELSAFTPTAVT